MILQQLLVGKKGNKQTLVLREGKKDNVDYFAFLASCITHRGRECNMESDTTAEREKARDCPAMVRANIVC